MRAREILPEKWSTKYKRSINCSNPKGFSQKAHCAGRKKNESSSEEEVYSKENNWGLSSEDAEHLLHQLDDPEYNITREFDDYPGFEYMYEYYTQHFSGGQYFYDILKDALEDIKDGYLEIDKDVDEGWKSKMAGAALAAANLLGSPAQAAEEPVKPITIAYVMIDGEMRKYNLGDRFSDAREAEKFISGVLDKQGLQGYQLEIKHGYPKKKDGEK
jgi:hypothetical protein